MTDYIDVLCDCGRPAVRVQTYEAENTRLTESLRAAAAALDQSYPLGSLDQLEWKLEQAEARLREYESALQLRLYYHVGDHTDLHENRCIPCQITKDAAEKALGYDELPADWKPALTQPAPEAGGTDA